MHGLDRSFSSTHFDTAATWLRVNDQVKGKVNGWLPCWDGPSGSAHGDALGARPVQVVLPVDGEDVVAMGRRHGGAGEVC